MKKMIEVEVNIDVARRMLSVAGVKDIKNMSDEDIFNNALSMNEGYGVKYSDNILPDMREKVKEYISELDAEIDRCHKLAEECMSDGAEITADKLVVRIKALREVKNDLQSRLEELV